jgi:hypothetical protein
MSLFESASLVVTPNGAKASKLYAIKPTSGAGDLSVTRATTATRVNSAGLIESVAVNVPRLDYTDSTCPSILVEPQRTNICLRSQALATAPWTLESGAVTNNAIISPDGTLNANKLENVGGSTGGVYQTITGLTFGDTYTVSFYGKLGTATNICLVMNNTIAWNTVGGQSFTAADGLNTTTWKKFSYTFTVPASIGFNIHIGTHSQTGVTPQSTGTFFVYGVQAEKSSYATSYIPTTSASVTRNADQIQKTGISSLIGQTEGTIFVDIYYDGINTFYPCSISNGAFTDAIYFEQYLGNIYAVVFDNGSLQFAFDAGVLSIGRHKMAIGYKANNTVFYIDGVLKYTDTSLTVPDCSRFDIGFVGGVGIDKTLVNTSALFKTRLTNAELAELTTL